MLGHLTFGSATSREDVAAVARLRHLAYSAVGKVDSSREPFDTLDGFDRRSILVMVQDGDKLVATSRVTLSAPTEYHGVAQIPWFGAHARVGSISRVATAPEVRGGLVMYATVLYAFRHAAEHGLTHLLGGASDALLPVYARVGAQPAGSRFRHPQLVEVEENLVVVEPQAALAGVGIRPDLLHCLRAVNELPLKQSAIVGDLLDG